MGLDGFCRLYHDADNRAEPVSVAVAGGDDRTVLEAMRIACDCGWIRPILVGPEPRIRSIAESGEIDLNEFAIRHAEGEAIAAAAVAEVRASRARALMKGQIATPELMKAVLDHEKGLRTGRVICQVVLMEIRRDRRRFLLADTGICVQPSLDERIDILRSTIEVADALWAKPPRVALMAATETIKPSMPETVEAVEICERGRQGVFGDCVIEGPLSFDLAYAAEAGAKKQVEGSVVGAADIMLFPNLLSANLTVKAIMYTADCQFGGVLRGTAAPVVFMSRADTTETRLNSLALALRIIDHG
ncbi:MAG: phosphate acyltransferase [Isosphaerales bacterium]